MKRIAVNLSNCRAVTAKRVHEYASLLRSTALTPRTHNVTTISRPRQRNHQLSTQLFQLWCLFTCKYPEKPSKVAVESSASRDFARHVAGFCAQGAHPRSAPNTIQSWISSPTARHHFVIIGDSRFHIGQKKPPSLAARKFKYMQGKVISASTPNSKELCNSAAFVYWIFKELFCKIDGVLLFTISFCPLSDS